MLSFLVVIGLVTLFFFGFILFFYRLESSPIYRTTREGMIRLFERVLSGEASDIEWRTFLSVPVRHDEFLEDLRLRCDYLDNEYGRHLRGYLLSRTGREKLQEILEELKAYDHKEF